MNSIKPSMSKKTRAIVAYIPNQPGYIREHHVLAETWRRCCIEDTDYICFGPAGIESQLDPDCIFIEHASVQEKYKDRCINSIHLFTSPHIDRLRAYTYLLRTDTDVFLTPAFSKLYPTKFMTGGGGYNNNQDIKDKLHALAKTLGLRHQGIYNIGSTWYGPAEQVIQAGQLSTQVLIELLSRYFLDNEGRWPGWYKGVALLYAAEIAVNHLIDKDKIEKNPNQFDYFSTSNNSINDHAHIHCWHTDAMFSKHGWWAGKYKDFDTDGLDTTIIKNYCLTVALQVEKQLKQAKEDQARAASQTKTQTLAKAITPELEPKPKTDTSEPPTRNLLAEMLHLTGLLRWAVHKGQVGRITKARHLVLVMAIRVVLQRLMKHGELLTLHGALPQEQDRGILAEMLHSVELLRWSVHKRPARRVARTKRMMMVMAIKTLLKWLTKEGDFMTIERALPPRGEMQGTEGRSQRAEDRGQKTEDRGQKTDSSRPLRPQPSVSSPREPAARLIASLASIKDRAETLPKILASLHNQRLPFDEIHVYCNDWEGPPADERVFVHVHPQGDQGDLGKLFGCGEGYNFLCDDDFIYPEDYTERLKQLIDQEQAIVGVYGMVLKPPIKNYFDDREVFHWVAALDRSRPVHALGTGTVAWHSAHFQLQQKHFTQPNMADCYLAVEAQKQRVGMRCIERPYQWLQPIHYKYSLWDSRDPSGKKQTEIINSITDWQIY